MKIKPSTLDQVFNSGGIIAYPTEAVYGLGCDPANEQAVLKLCVLKQRPVNKGLIVVTSDLASLSSWLQPLTDAQHQKVLATWPGPTTWLIPTLASAPIWLTGEHDCLAVRISAHPIVAELCAQVGPIVSTSANVSAQPACRSAEEVSAVFRHSVDMIIPGDVDPEAEPSTIIDLRTDKIIRGWYG